MKKRISYDNMYMNPRPYGRLFLIGTLISGVIFIISKCNSERKWPYENFVRRAVIENISISPFIESIKIDTTIDREVVIEAIKKQLKERKNADMLKWKTEYEYYKDRYNQSLRMYGRYVADGTYKDRLKENKTIYENSLKGIFPHNHFKFYEDRIKNPPKWEQITIRYMLNKEGPLIVEKYRSEIINGDTSLYPTKKGLVHYMGL